MWMGIDTSSYEINLGICKDGRILFEFSQHFETARSENLLKIIDFALKSLNINLENLEGFAITTGPGSFTGLRIGLSCVKGLAFPLKKKVVAIATDEALSRCIPSPGYKILTLIDARCGEVYASLFDTDYKKLWDNKVLKPEEILKEIREKVIISGDGAYRYKGIFNDNFIFSEPFLTSPRGGVVAKIGEEKAKKGEFADIISLEPHYILPPRIKKPKF